MCQVKHIWQCLPKRSGRIEKKNLLQLWFSFLTAHTTVIMQSWFWICSSEIIIIASIYSYWSTERWLVAIVVFPYLAGRNKNPFQKEAKYTHNNITAFVQESSEIRAGKLEWHFSKIQSYDKKNQEKIRRIAQVYVQFRKPKGKWQKTPQRFLIIAYQQNAVKPFLLQNAVLLIILWW